MKQRKWDTKTKLTVEMQGMKGQATVQEICNRYGIGQAQYYQWRDQFLSHAGQVFELGKQNDREARLKEENRRLKGLVGELTMELKKNDEVFQ